MVDTKGRRLFAQEAQRQKITLDLMPLRKSATVDDEQESEIKFRLCTHNRNYGLTR